MHLVERGLFGVDGKLGCGLEPLVVVAGGAGELQVEAQDFVVGGEQPVVGVGLGGLADEGGGCCGAHRPLLIQIGLDAAAALLS